MTINVPYTSQKTTAASFNPHVEDHLNGLYSTEQSRVCTKHAQVRPLESKFVKPNSASHSFAFWWNQTLVCRPQENTSPMAYMKLAHKNLSVGWSTGFSKKRYIKQISTHYCRVSNLRDRLAHPIHRRLRKLAIWPFSRVENPQNYASSFFNNGVPLWPKHYTQIGLADRTSIQLKTLRPTCTDCYSIVPATDSRFQWPFIRFTDLDLGGHAGVHFDCILVVLVTVVYQNEHQSRERSPPDYHCPVDHFWGGDALVGFDACWFGFWTKLPIQSSPV